MRYYRITSAGGAYIGTYEGETQRDAIEAMWLDAMWAPSRMDVRALRDDARLSDEATVALCDAALSGDKDALDTCYGHIRDARAEELEVSPVKAPRVQRADTIMAAIGHRVVTDPAEPGDRDSGRLYLDDDHAWVWCAWDQGAASRICRVDPRRTLRQVGLMLEPKGGAL